MIGSELLSDRVSVKDTNLHSFFLVQRFIINCIKHGGKRKEQSGVE